jgi:hypothetical protein
MPSGADGGAAVWVANADDHTKRRLPATRIFGGFAPVAAFDNNDPPCIERLPIETKRIQSACDTFSVFSAKPYATVHAARRSPYRRKRW